MISKKIVSFLNEIKSTQINDLIGDVLQIVKKDFEELDKKIFSSEIPKDKLVSTTLFDRLPFGIYRVRANGEILYANLALVKMFGYPSLEIMLKVIRKTGTLYINSDVRKLYLERMEKEGIIRDFENKCLHANGKAIWVKESCTTIFKENGEIDYYEGVLMDITKIKETEEALRTSTQKQLQLIEIMNEGFVQTDSIDDEELITLVNESLCRILGYKRDELVGHPLREFFDDENQKVLTLQNEKRKNSLIDSYELTWPKKDGSKISTIVSPQVLKDQKGNIVHNSAVITDITELKKIQKELQEAKEKAEESALYDDLTGLANRKLFYDRLERNIRTAARNNDRERPAILFMDLDKFKMVNDNYGHEAGDQILMAVAERLRKILREEDTICRMGGDEFVILLPKIQDVENAATVAEKIRIKLAEPFMLLIDELETEISISTSIGISIFHDDVEDPEVLVNEADKAQSLAKKGGRNRYHFYKEHEHKEAMEKFYLEAALKRAIGTDQLYQDYQPILDIETGKLVGFEALTRWLRPNHGVVQPLDFIPMAEKTNLINKVGKDVFFQTCIQIKKWQEMGLSLMKVSINVSEKQFTEDLPGEIEDVLKFTNLDSQFLEIELSDGTVMKNIKETNEILQRLREIGLTIYIDDFISSALSLRILKELEIQTIKINLTTFENNLKDKKDVALLRRMIQLAQDYEYPVVAVGVENKEQFRMLQDMECDRVQGYFYGRPLSVIDTEKFIENPPSLKSLLEGDTN